MKYPCNTHMLFSCLPMIKPVSMISSSCIYNLTHFIHDLYVSYLFLWIFVSIICFFFFWFLANPFSPQVWHVKVSAKDKSCSYSFYMNPWPFWSAAYLSWPGPYLTFDRVLTALHGDVFGYITPSDTLLLIIWHISPGKSSLALSGDSLILPFVIMIFFICVPPA